jgi:natural product precursor
MITNDLRISKIVNKQISQRRLADIRGGKKCTCGCCYYPASNEDYSIGGEMVSSGLGPDYCPPA